MDKDRAEKRFAPPLLWSSFSMRDKLDYLRGGKQPARVPRQKESLGRRVWSWAYFYLWFLAGPIAMYTELGSSRYSWLVDIGCFAMLIWSVAGDGPRVTTGQMAVCLVTVLAATGYGVVRLWNSPVVIPLVPVFLFFLLFAVLMARVAWQRRRSQPV